MRTNDPPVGDPTAVFGRRCVAFAVDFIIVFAVFVAAFLSSSTLEDVEDSRIADQICVYYDELGNGDVCLDLSLVFVLESGRFADIALWGIVASALNLVVVAAITGGSLGKLAAGIRVVDRDTFNRAGVHKHLLRWVLWVVDAFPWFLPVPLTGLIFSLVSRGHRRVGDFAAKTLVVDKKYVGIPTLLPGVNDAGMATAALPGLWSPPADPPHTRAPATEPPATDPAAAAHTAWPTTEPPATEPPAADPAATAHTAATAADAHTTAPATTAHTTDPAATAHTAAPTTDAHTDAHTAAHTAAPTTDAHTTAPNTTAPTTDPTATAPATDAPTTDPAAAAHTAAPVTGPPATEMPVTGPAAAAHTAGPAAHGTQPGADASDRDRIEPIYEQTKETAEGQLAGEQASQPGVDAPAWDAARDTYIQWDHELQAWMEWDESQRRWIPISQ